MAIAPIDLQTLFTQIDKVGKQEAAQREGAAIQHAVQQAHVQQRTDERVRSVNEAQNTGEGAEEIKDKNGGGPQERGRREAQGKKAAEGEPEVIRDPDLGRNIDLSL